MSFMEIVLHYGISGDDGAKVGDQHKLQLSGNYFEHGHPLTRRLIALLSAIQKWYNVLVYGERGTLSFVSNFRRR